MKLSMNELADLRHFVRSELNQMMGYAELLASAVADQVSAPAQQRLGEVQERVLRVLESFRVFLSESVVEGESCLVEVPETMDADLAAIEDHVNELIAELADRFLPDLELIQRSCLSLRRTLKRPYTKGAESSRGVAPNVFIETAYRAIIPAKIEGGGNLLMVDDSEANCLLIERQVSVLGLTVTSVRNGPSALAALTRQHYDCVLLDMRLPGMSGQSVLLHIRANPEWISIPVLMLSALDELGEAARCIDIGAEDYLIRPVDSSLLRAKLHSTIQRKQLHESCRLLGRDLEFKNEELQRFVLVASHDLQAPLKSLRGNLLSLESALRAGQVEEQQELLDDSSRRCERMSALVQDLLRYAQLGQVEAFVEYVELDWVLSEALFNLGKDLEASRADVVIGKLPAVRADFKQMVYAMQNLLENSIRYRGELSPRIEVSSQEREGEFVISIRDNGCGIPEGQRQRVFEPFFRLHGDELPGTGIGLAIARRALEKAGGRIWVEPESGGGSCFCLSFPKPG